MPGLSQRQAESELRPTLEQIFLDPPLHGRAPRLVSASADARFALVSWSPQGPATLRLIPTDVPAAEGAGPALQDLLPAPLDDSNPTLRTAWSRRGSRLAVGRGRVVWILDPETGTVDELLRWSSQDETQEGEFQDVRRLSFGLDDRSLQVEDGEEIREVPLPEGRPAASLGLTDTDWLSAEVEAGADQLRWSRDHTVVFGIDPVPLHRAAPDEQVYHLASGRAVTLEGLAGMEDLQQVDLSPDGRFLFAVERDRSGEPEPTEVPDYLTQRVTHRDGRRRLAEDRPSPRRLWMWDTDSGAREELQVRAVAEDEPRPLVLPSKIGWAPRPVGEPAALAFEVLSEDYRDLELWIWSEGALTRVHTQRDDAWIGGPARTTRWTADGARLVFGSEAERSSTTPGRSQLFCLEPGTGELLQMTAVAGEVTSFRTLDGGGVLVQASEEDPARRVYMHVSSDAVQGRWAPQPRPFALPAGWNGRGVAARDGSRVIALHQSLLRPGELVAADHQAAVVLTDTEPEAFSAIPWIRPETIVVARPDGTRIYAHVYLPPEVSLETPGPPRATVVFVHGAGYLQNVTDSMTSYPLNAMFHSRLARLGYPVIDVDYRGSSGYGQAFRTAVQHHLGGEDLADIHAVVDDLVTLGLVDPDRVGVYGGSYGGFLTLMALFTAPERWAVGCALRSVTDWRTYTPGYTQPRLGRPSTHPQAYVRSSPIDHVDGLSDPLLVLHGMVDSNVFAQDSIRLIEALIDRGKRFDAMLYPSQGHAFSDGAHWLDEYRRIEGYLLAHLGPPVLLPHAQYALDAGAWYLLGHDAWSPGGDDDRGGGPTGPLTPQATRGDAVGTQRAWRRRD